MGGGQVHGLAFATNDAGWVIILINALLCDLEELLCAFEKVPLCYLCFESFGADERFGVIGADKSLGVGRVDKRLLDD